MRIDTLATLGHLNIRKEGDDKVLAIDLKLECEIDADDLIEFHPNLRSLLWAGDDPRFSTLIESVNLIGELRHYDVHIAEQPLRDVTLKRFEVSPYPRARAGLKFVASAHPESGQTIAILSEFVTEKVSFTAHAMSDLLADAHVRIKAARAFGDEVKALADRAISDAGAPRTRKQKRKGDEANA